MNVGQALDAKGAGVLGRPGSGVTAAEVRPRPGERSLLPAITIADSWLPPSWSECGSCIAGVKADF